jgi:hypothetical protein
MYAQQPQLCSFAPNNYSQQLAIYTPLGTLAAVQEATALSHSSNLQFTQRSSCSVSCLLHLPAACVARRAVHMQQVPSN